MVIMKQLADDQKKEHRLVSGYDHFLRHLKIWKPAPEKAWMIGRWEWLKTHSLFRHQIRPYEKKMMMIRSIGKNFSPSLKSEPLPPKDQVFRRLSSHMSSSFFRLNLLFLKESRREKFRIRCERELLLLLFSSSSFPLLIRFPSLFPFSAWCDCRTWFRRVISPLLLSSHSSSSPSFFDGEEPNLKWEKREGERDRQQKPDQNSQREERILSVGMRNGLKNVRGIGITILNIQASFSSLWLLIDTHWDTSGGFQSGIFPSRLKSLLFLLGDPTFNGVRRRRMVKAARQRSLCWWWSSHLSVLEKNKRGDEHFVYKPLEKGRVEISLTAASPHQPPTPLISFPFLIILSSSCWSSS